MNARDQAIAEFARRSVEEGTAASYDSYLRLITETDDPYAPGRKLPETAKGFATLLTLPSTKISTAYMRRIWSALVWKLESADQAPSAQEVAQLERVMEACRRANPEKAVSRGAIDAAMFGDVLRMLDEEQYADDEIKIGLIFQCLGFGLRGGQITKLEAKDFHRVTKGWIYVGPRHKTAKVGASTAEQEKHEPSDAVMPIIDAYLNAVGTEGKLFARYPLREVTAILQRAAKRFDGTREGWSQNYSWTGAHNLRHGAALDAKQEGDVEAVGRRTGHKTVAIKEHYARDHAERHQVAPADRTRFNKRNKQHKKAENKKQARVATRKLKIRVTKAGLKRRK